MAKNNNWVKLGAIMKRKDGGLYIKLDDSIKTLNINGALIDTKFINLEKPQAKYERMLEKGAITEDVYQERVGAIPEFVKYELSIAPSKE